MVDQVSEKTRDTWGEVMEYGIIEFLNICCYIKDKNNWEANERKK